MLRLLEMVPESVTVCTLFHYYRRKVIKEKLNSKGLGSQKWLMNVNSNFTLFLKFLLRFTFCVVWLLSFVLGGRSVVDDLCVCAQTQIPEHGSKKEPTC